MMLKPTSHVLDSVRVGDCMHAGVLSCRHDTPLSTVAEMMSSRHVHALVVSGTTGAAAIIVSDVDLIGALAVAHDGLVVSQVALTEALTAPSDAPIREAASVMADHGVNHLIVLDAANGHPVGVLSSTDIVAAYARAIRPESVSAH